MSPHSDIGMPAEIIQIVQDEAEWATPFAMATKIQSIHPTFLFCLHASDVQVALFGIASFLQYHSALHLDFLSALMASSVPHPGYTKTACNGLLLVVDYYNR